MEIIIGKTAGFCFGVANAVNKSKKELEVQKKLYCLGELVHNKEVTKELENEGIEFVESIEKARKNVIIRAHGEPERTYKKAEEMNLNIIDLTCPKVIKIHDIAKEYSKNGYFIFLIGKSNHPETIGTISYCGNNSCIIEEEKDLEEALSKFYKTNLKRILVISQTTFSMEMFEKITSKLEDLIRIKDIELEIKNTICDATKLRQEETCKISKEVDVMIIIGGRHSSNTNKLYNIASAYCKNSILIETYEELDIEYIRDFKKTGIMAGASTPQKSIDLVVEKLKKIC